MMQASLVNQVKEAEIEIRPYTTNDTGHPEAMHGPSAFRWFH